MGGRFNVDAGFLQEGITYNSKSSAILQKIVKIHVGQRDYSTGRFNFIDWLIL